MTTVRSAERQAYLFRKCPLCDNFILDKRAADEPDLEFIQVRFQTTSVQDLFMIEEKVNPDNNCILATLCTGLLKFKKLRRVSVEVVITEDPVRDDINCYDSSFIAPHFKRLANSLTLVDFRFRLFGYAAPEGGSEDEDGDVCEDEVDEDGHEEIQRDMSVGLDAAIRRNRRAEHAWRTAGVALAFYRANRNHPLRSSIVAKVESAPKDCNKEMTMMHTILAMTCPISRRYTSDSRDRADWCAKVRKLDVDAFVDSRFFQASIAEAVKSRVGSDLKKRSHE